MWPSSSATPSRIRARIPAEAFDLVAATRDLVEAVVMTDVDAGTRADAAAELRRLTGVLGAA